MDFQEKFLQFHNEQSCENKDLPTLLAVSGGIDSMVMCHLYHASGLPFAVAHCNFQLRGAESDEDECFVQKVAANCGALFFSKKFNTKKHAEEAGISTQMAARNLRYAWFAELVETHGYGALATAHNLNDSAETMLLNFVRGTGLAGLTGIGTAKWQNIQVIRPLLFASRADILAYAQAHDLPWREDSSNATDAYARNFIRHQVTPKLEEINPNFLHTASRNGQKIREARQNLDFFTRKFLGIEPMLHGNELKGIAIDKHRLKMLPVPVGALRDLLTPYGFTDELVRQLAENMGKIGMELQSDTGWKALCDRYEIVVHHPQEHAQDDAIVIQEGDLMVRLQDGGSMVLMPAAPEPPFPDGQSEILVNADKLVFPLTLRHWQEGDAFQPIGAVAQTVKLQDFFTNNKLSRIEKGQVWLLVNGDGNIIWVLGMRFDNRFKIAPNCSAAMKIAWIRAEKN